MGWLFPANFLSKRGTDPQAEKEKQKQEHHQALYFWWDRLHEPVMPLTLLCGPS